MTSYTVQARHSYCMCNGDIIICGDNLNTDQWDFQPCISKNTCYGKVEIDFTKFHNIIPITKDHTNYSLSHM